MDKYLLWNSNNSKNTIILEEFIKDSLSENVIEDLIYMLANLLNKNILNNLNNNPNVIAEDDMLYYKGTLKNVSLKIYLDKFWILFIDDAYSSLGISYDYWNITDELKKELYDYIRDTIEDNLGYVVYHGFSESDGNKYLHIYTEDNVVLINDFEKKSLGRFLYLLYLLDYYRNLKGAQKVCVVTTELKPLINKTKEIMERLGTLSRSEFIKLYPKYEDFYDDIYFDFKTKTRESFIINLMSIILTLSSSSIRGNYDKKTNTLKMEYHKPFETIFEQCLSQRHVTVDNQVYNIDSNFVITLLGYNMGNNQGHANILIIDKLNKTVERFEPNGTHSLNRDDMFSQVSNMMDIVLEEYFKKYNLKYIKPIDLCPKIGIQAMESFFKDSVGYCVTWSILYAQERVFFSTGPGDVAKNLIDIIDKKYQISSPLDTNHIFGIKLERWLNHKIDEIFNLLNYIYDTISKEFNIKKIRYQRDCEGKSCLIQL